MAKLKAWLHAHDESCQPTGEHAIRALRHLSRHEKKQLFSPDISFMRSAEGHWFEMMTYELFLDLATKTDTIKKVVLKGADAPYRWQPVKMGQNGFFYSRNGDLTLRGNGQDLAEFDLLLQKKDGSIVFVEVVTSPADLKDFLQEVYYKKQVIRYLFDQKAVTFILVTSFPLSNYKGGRKVLGSDEHISISTLPCTEMRSYISGNWPKKIEKPKVPDANTCYLHDLTIAAPFHYQTIHATERDWAIQQICNRNGSELVLPSPERTAPLVKKILFGSVYVSGFKQICKQYTIHVKGEDLSFETVMKRYSKVILAADLPDYTPLLYLRNRQKKEYHKLVYHHPGVFKFERRTPPKVGFYLWLESLEPQLGTNISLTIIKTLIPYALQIPHDEIP